MNLKIKVAENWRKVEGIAEEVGVECVLTYRDSWMTSEGRWQPTGSYQRTALRLENDQFKLEYHMLDVLRVDCGERVRIYHKWDDKTRRKVVVEALQILDENGQPKFTYLRNP